MPRRLATFVLACCVTLAGLTARPFTASCCVVRQSAAHACCKIPETLRATTCCRGPQELQQRTVNSHLQTPQLSLTTVAFVATTASPALVGHATPAALDLRGLAPPTTLTAQHTSLLL